MGTQTGRTVRIMDTKKNQDDGRSTIGLQSNYDVPYRPIASPDLIIRYLLLNKNVIRRDDFAQREIDRP